VQSKYEQQCWSKIEAFYAKAEDFQAGDLSCKTAGMTIQLSEDYENLSEVRFDRFIREFLSGTLTHHPCK